ncbi:uncharacterized protein LOC115632587 [Scaptodrosophila lebanonensis]|uniref:Uncharacterized protein LOC115632587 n=1 Tax=Drosophila lebanonensis TaxID=7225 RepID=A0A6J2UAX6_DROLE|nr:uncharacterized protein LOC115632587 [Scaptodrosophila lebanonensis]
MFKIILLFVALYAALSQARPSYLHGSSALLPSYETVEYAPTLIGHSYESLPTAVSHQSSTVVHEKRPYWRPIVGHAPLLNTYAPTVTYAAASPISYGSGWYDSAGWGAESYPSIYLK